jgi:hypothetical protein
MFCIQKETVAVMPRAKLLLHVHFCCVGHYLSALVMNGVKGTEEGHVWVPIVCQIVKLIYVDDNLCPVLRKRLLLQCPEPCWDCMFIFVAEAIICHW